MDSTTSPAIPEENPLMRPDHELPAPHDMLIESEEKDGIHSSGGASNNASDQNKRSAFPMWIFPLIALFIVLLAGAMYLLNMQKVDEPKAVPPVQPTSTPTMLPTPTLMPVDTSAWKTYKNTQYKYEIKYPADMYEVQTNSSPSGQIQFASLAKLNAEHCCSTYENMFYITPTKNTDVKHIENKNDFFSPDYIKQWGSPTVFEYDLGGTKSWRVDNCCGGVGGYEFDIYTLHNNTVFRIEGIPDAYESEERKGPEVGQERKAIHDAMLRSFRFTDVVASPSPTVAGSSENMVACTMDAKLCPDGSSVGRVGPKCEFAACPK